MASKASDDIEKEWTFVDKDGKIDIQARKNSVLYSKSHSGEDCALVSQSEVLSLEDGESEPEFEVLSGFQCHSPPSEDEESPHCKDDTGDHVNDVHKSSEADDCELGTDPGSIQEDGCQCAADDGIMIISNHFCANEKDDSSGDICAVNAIGSEHDHGNSASSNISLVPVDGWQELPQLSESGSLSFPTESSNSEDDNDIEPIPEEYTSQDFVDLGRDPCEAIAESRASMFSFDSDIFNQSYVDEDIDGEEEQSCITEASIYDEKTDGLNADESVDHVKDIASGDSSSILLDVPTLFVFLGVTTALGFSIGYGLSVYISSQALGSSGGVKRPGSKTPFPLDSDSLEPLDEVSRDFLDQLTMWKLEDQLDQQKEQEPQTEPGDLFDTKTLHEKLQQKHFKFMSQHENVKQRLCASKVMSWYWRLKFEEEKSKRGGSNEWNKALQEQLEHMEQLYLREKHVADMWRHRHANTKSHEDMARDVKLERYWKDFLTRWRKTGQKHAGLNETGKLTNSTEKPVTAQRKLEPQRTKTDRMRDSPKGEFTNRWTKDSRSLSKGIDGESCPMKKNCAVRKKGKTKDVSLRSEELSLTSLSEQNKFSPLLWPVFANSGSEEDVGKQNRLDKTSENGVASEFLHKANELKSISKAQDKDFESPLYNNPQSSLGLFAPWAGYNDIILSLLGDNTRENRKLPANPASKKTSVQAHLSGGEPKTQNRVEQEVLEKPRPLSKYRKTKYFSGWPVKCYRGDYASRRCKKLKALRHPRVSKPRRIREKQNGVSNASRRRQQQFPLKRQKRILRNLTKFREEEIRRHRIQRRKLRKKEKDVEKRVQEANRLLSELKKGRREIKIEKRIIRRSWKELKKEKKNFSREMEVHKHDKKGLEEFIAKLKTEKKRMKKMKGKFKEKIKELLTKEKKGKELRKKLEAEKKKEMEKLRAEIVQEKEKLRKQHRSLKALKRAARKELKNWLKELKKLKGRKKRRRATEQAKDREKARRKFEKTENLRQRQQEYDAVVREQEEYDSEKRKRKGEYGEHKKRKAPEDMKQEDDTERNSAREETGDRKHFLGRQFENVKQWFSSVHKKAVEKQNAYLRGFLAKTAVFHRNGEGETSEIKSEDQKSRLEDVKDWLSSVHKKTLGKQKAYLRSLIPQRILNSYRAMQSSELSKKDRAKENKEEENLSGLPNGGEGKIKTGLTKEKSGDTARREGSKYVAVNLESETYPREQKGKEESDLKIRKSELATVSDNKALASFVNLTSNVELVKILVKGLERKEREGKSRSDKVEGADTTAFVIVSKESTDLDSSLKKTVGNLKPKSPKGRLAFAQGPIVAEDFKAEPRRSHRQKVHEESITAERSKEKKVVPQGPRLSEDERYVRPSKKTMRKQVDLKGDVCEFEDASNWEEIPPPDWVFRRAKKRARGRADQRSVPWYEKRAQDRSSQREGDEHVTQFPCGPWYQRRAKDRSVQRRRDKHTTQFPCGQEWNHHEDRSPNPCYDEDRKSDSAIPRVKNSKRSADQRRRPWYDRRAQERNFQRKNDEHKTQFRRGDKRKRDEDWSFGRANDHASQQSHLDPWDFRPAEGREGSDSFFEQEADSRESWDSFLEQEAEGREGWDSFFEQFYDWIPRGPHVDEHRSQ